MPCYHPVSGFRAGNGAWTSNPYKSPGRMPMTRKCGQCMGCRIRDSGDWKVRLLHEASRHAESTFITLTYDDDFLPPHGSLRMSDVSVFMKALRQLIAPVRIRFHCNSEYGPTTWRPHYHGAIFGFGFPDMKPWRRTGAGELSFSSELLAKAWGRGHCELAPLTPGNAGYLAKHNVGKLTGPVADEAYRRVDPESGEVVELERPCTRMSRRPGIGAGWIDEFEGDFFPSGFAVVDGHKVPAPRYYSKRLKGRHEFGGEDVFGPIDDAEVMARKASAMLKTPEGRLNATPERLAVREECLELKIKRLRRDAV